jgi:hypothetical protein
MYEMFCLYEDYDTYNAAIIQSIIWGFHYHSYIYADKHPNLPLPVAFGPLKLSIKSIHCLILETNINKPSLDIFLPHYVNCPPKQSATIPILHCVTVHRYFSPIIPKCFTTIFYGGFKTGNIVRLEDAGP